MAKREQKILFVVHEETAEGWARQEPMYQISSKDVLNAKQLLVRLTRAKSAYARIIQFEYGPLEPLVPSTSRFTWSEIVDDLGGFPVEIAGLRRTKCVAIVFRELRSRIGSRATVNRRLVID